MPDRIPLDHMTSDQLDALYERLEDDAKVISHLGGEERRRLDAEAAIARVRALHTPTQRLGRAWCDACSVRRRTGLKTDDEWVAYIPYPCPTLEELDGIAPEPTAIEATEPAMITDPAYLHHLYTETIRHWWDADDNGAAEIATAVLRVRDRHIAHLNQRLQLAQATLNDHAEADSADASAGSYAHRAERIEAALTRARQLHRATCPLARGIVEPPAFTCDWCEALDEADALPAHLANLTETTTLEDQ